MFPSESVLQTAIVSLALEMNTAVRIESLPADWPGTLAPWLSEVLPEEGLVADRLASDLVFDANVRRDNLLCAYVGDELVGFMTVIWRRIPQETAPPDSDRGYLTLFGVRRSFRRQGVGDALLLEAEDRARRAGCKSIWVSPYSPGYVVPGLDLRAHAEAIAFLEARGYEEVYRPLAMQTELWDVRRPDWVLAHEERLAKEGVAIEGYEPSVSLQLAEFTRAEFPGDWERWVRRAVEDISRGDDPCRLIVALEKGQVLGFSHYGFDRFGPVGVAQSQRGRGIGQALLYATLDAQKRRGFRSSWFLWSDDRTNDRLYREAGFVEKRRFVVMKKTL